MAAILVEENFLNSCSPFCFAAGAHSGNERQKAPLKNINENLFGKKQFYKRSKE